MGYVSPVVKKSFEERKEKVSRLIKNSGINYNKFGIFGSYARNDYTASSDIDFCLIVDEKPSRYLTGSLWEDADLLGADITIVSSDYFNHSDSQFARQLRRDFMEVF